MRQDLQRQPDAPFLNVFMLTLVVLFFLQTTTLFSATDITGIVTAKRDNLLKVEFQFHETAVPKTGDKVEFSLQLDGMSVGAGIGRVTQVDGGTAWVQISDGQPDLKMDAVIHASESTVSKPDNNKSVEPEGSKKEQEEIKIDILSQKKDSLVEEVNKQLYDAVSRGDLKAVRKTLEKGANINHSNDQWRSPLHFAVSVAATCPKGKCIDMVELLLASGADPSLEDDFGVTPVSYAVFSPPFGMIGKNSIQDTIGLLEILIKAGASTTQHTSTNFTPLIWAAATNLQLDSLYYLIESGVDVNAQIKAHASIPNKFHGVSALMMAAYTLDVNKVALLLLAGADTEPKSADGLSALNYTRMAFTRDTEVFKEKEKVFNALFRTAHELHHDGSNHSDQWKAKRIEEIILEPASLRKKSHEIMQKKLADASKNNQLATVDWILKSGVKAKQSESIKKKQAKVIALLKQQQHIEVHQTELGIVITLSGVLFESGNSELNPSKVQYLDRSILTLLQSEPDRKIRIEGHTDSSGKDSKNQILSERRAKAIRDVLVKKGVDVERITTIGLGESYPIESNENKLGRSKNRRVDVILVNQKVDDGVNKATLRKDNAPPLHRCDELAGDPWDNQHIGPTIKFSLLKASQAIMACKDAIKKYPNSPRFLFQLARAYTAGKQFDNALSFYKQAAKQNYAAAQYNLGVMYFHGHGVSSDNVESFKWYLKAAKQDHFSAQYNVGLRYDNGKIVPEDDAEAVKWYLMAAEQGYDMAQNKLGYMYEFGKGVKQDYSKALKWYHKSAEQGNMRAQSNLGYLYRFGKVVDRDYVKAIKWYRKAAEQGYSNAQYLLGGMYADGKGVKKDYSKALKWYRKSVEQGNAYAQYALAGMYEFGLGVKKSLKKAFKWYHKAAKQGDAGAQYSLGNMYSLGYGVKKNRKKAIYWLKKAASQGNEYAKKELDALRKKGY